MHNVHFYAFMQGRRKRFRGQGKKTFRPSSNGRLVKNLDTKSARLTVSRRVPWDWSERVDVCNRQVVALLREIKTNVKTFEPRNIYQSLRPLFGTAFIVWTENSLTSLDSFISYTHIKEAIRKYVVTRQFKLLMSVVKSLCIS
jgi:hypothetical protein